MNKNYHVSTVQKAINILNFFKEHNKLSFTRLQKLSGYNKSTLYRILYTLEYNDYLKKDKHGRYELGINIFVLGNRISRSDQLIKFSTPYLQEISSLLEFTVHLGILNNNNIVIINKVQPDQNIQMVSRIGSAVPPHCTGQGKTLLAFSSKKKVEQIIKKHGLKKYTGNTITDKCSFYKELEHIREKEYAVDDSEHEKNIRCISVPIFDAEGKIQAALSISGLITDFPAELEELERMAFKLSKIRDKICEKMGYN